LQSLSTPSHTSADGTQAPPVLLLLLLLDVAPPAPLLLDVAPPAPLLLVVEPPAPLLLVVAPPAPPVLDSPPFPASPFVVVENGASRSLPHADTRARRSAADSNAIIDPFMMDPFGANMSCPPATIPWSGERGSWRSLDWLHGEQQGTYRSTIRPLSVR
jgi:hypothetical protein